MAKTPRSKKPPMTQDAPPQFFARGVVVTSAELARGREVRRHYRSPAHMREAAAVLRHPDPRELERLGLALGSRWTATADELEREADRWASESVIDST